MRGLPHSSHWGAFSVLLREQRIEVVPHPRDPDPSALLGNIPAAVSHPARIARPMVRRGWLERGPAPDLRRGRDEFVPVAWSRALDLVAAELRRVYTAHGPRAIFGGSYGWASAGRFHDAQSQIHRFLNLAGGYVRSVGSYSSGAATVILPHVLGPQGAVAGNNVSWTELVAESALVLAFGGMALKNNDVGGGGTSRHIARGQLRAARDRGVEFHLISPLRDDLPAEIEAVWHPIRPGTDVALMLGLAHTLVSRATARPRVSRSVLRRLGGVRGLSSRPPRRPAKGRGLGRDDLRLARGGDRRTRAASRGAAHLGHLLAIAAAVRAWRTTGLDGCRVGGAAGPDRPAGWRLRLCAGVDLQYRKAGPGGAGSHSAARPQQHCRFHPGGAPCRYAAASGRTLRLQRAAARLPRHQVGLLGRRQSVPPPSGPEPAAPSLCATRYGHRSRFGMDRERAACRCRAAGDDHPRARGYRRRRRRSAARRDASGGGALS